MHKGKKRTAVEDWNWEAGRGENLRKGTRSPLEFPLRLSGKRDRCSVHDPVLYAATGWSLSDRLGPLLFHHAGVSPRRLCLHVILVIPED